LLNSLGFLSENQPIFLSCSGSGESHYPFWEKACPTRQAGFPKIKKITEGAKGSL
jgi:hypothetical protein